MRVALVSDWFLPRTGGIELHLRDLAIALRAHDIDARVVTTTRGDSVVNGVPVHRIHVPLLPFAGVSFPPQAMRRMRALLHEERFDVVHAHASVISPLAYAGAVAGAGAGLPTVVTFHSMMHGTALLLGATEALLGWTRDRVALTAVSSVVAAQAASWMPERSVGVLPNGVDAAFWSQLSPPTHAKKEDVLFVSAMRLTRKKRPERLLHAFAQAVRVTAGGPMLRLVVAGEGPDRAALGRLAVELGVGDRVELTGQLTRDELRTLYARADAFVLPSERESFGLSALEARAAGLPVIAMLASGARDFIQPARNGLLAKDAEELGQLMIRVALDAPFRAFVARNNGTPPQEYDWPHVVARHLHFYRAAAELLPAPAAMSAG